LPTLDRCGGTTRHLPSPRRVYLSGTEDENESETAEEMHSGLGVFRSRDLGMRSVVRDVCIPLNWRMDNALAGDRANRADAESEDRVIDWIAAKRPVARLFRGRVSTPIGRHATCLLWMVLKAPRIEFSRFVEPTPVDSHVETITVWDILDWPTIYILVSHISNQRLSSAGSSVPLTTWPPARSSP
jgi:hypothetical protein